MFTMPVDDDAAVVSRFPSAKSQTAQRVPEPAHTIDVGDDGKFTLDGAPTLVRPEIRGARIACHLVTWRAFERLRELQKAAG